MLKRDKNGKIKRKSYSDDVRKLIYIKAGGRCELCGRKILLDDMTLDHVNLLSMGGDDDVENLSIFTSSPAARAAFFQLYFISVY